MMTAIISVFVRRFGSGRGMARLLVWVIGIVYALALLVLWFHGAYRMEIAMAAVIALLAHAQEEWTFDRLLPNSHRIGRCAHAVGYGLLIAVFWLVEKWFATNPSGVSYAAVLAFWSPWAAIQIAAVLTRKEWSKLQEETKSG